MTDKSGVSRTAVSLPQGGGAVASIGEDFQVDLTRGAGTYSIPIVTPQGRGKLQPDLRLAYSTTAGFGPAGLGWAIDPGRIYRRTDVGVPTFTDDRDVFALNGEELLHTGGGQYRCRIERQFRRIVQVGEQWEVSERDGRLFVYGETPEARLSDPAAPARVQAWLLSRVEDPNGNAIRYTYRRDTRTVTAGLTFAAAQVYPDRVEYNPHGGGWLNTLLFHYDFADPNAPARPDAHLDYRPGFPVYTGWRLRQIEVRADVPGKFAGPVRRYGLGYTEDPDTGLALLQQVTVTGLDDQGSALSLPPVRFAYSRLDTSGAAAEPLEGAPSVDLAGGGIELVDLTANGLPDIVSTTPGNHTFWLNNRWRSPASLPAGQRHFAPGTAMGGSPNASLTQPSTHLADVRGRMAADLLTAAGSFDSPSHAVSHADILARNIRWGAGTPFAAPPPFNFQDGETRVADLTGRGRADVIRVENGQFRFWLNLPSGQYEDRGTGPAISGLSFANPEWTLADLNGDGLVDIVRVRNGRIDYYPNLGNGHRSGPLFASAAIVMGNGQALRQGQTEWDPQRLIFLDINGDGLDDAVYLYTDRLVCYINRGGWSWSNAITIYLKENGAPVSLTTNRASIRQADMLGTGTSGILWSGSGVPMRYLNPAGGRKPLLLTGVDSGTGGQTAISYHCTATPGGREWTTRMPFPLHVIDRMTLTDAVTGQTWTTLYRFLDGSYDRERREFLAFTHVEVEELGDEGSPDPACETRLTVTRHHPGTTSATDPVERAKARALAGLPLRQAISGWDAARPCRVTEWLYEADVPVHFPGSGTGRVQGTNGFSPRSGDGQPAPEPAAVALSTHELQLVYDPVSGGSADRTAALGGTLTRHTYRDRFRVLDPYGRVQETLTANDVRITASPGPDAESLLRVDAASDPLTLREDGVAVAAPTGRLTRTRFTYAANPTLHLVSLTATAVTRSQGQVIQDVRRYYDGPDYVGLAIGQADRGNLAREDALVLRDDQYQAAYADFPGGPPDLGRLGYHRQPYGTAVVLPTIARVASLLGFRLWEFVPRVSGLARFFVRFEGSGYFVNTRRLRYARLDSGAPAYGFVAGQLDPQGSETVYTPDDFYLYTAAQTDPAGNTAAAEADYRTGRIRSVTDANGHVSENRYDALGRTLAVVKPGDSPSVPTVTYEYSPPDGPLPVYVRTRIRESAGAAGTFESVEYRDGWGKVLQTRTEAENGQYAITGAAEYNARGGLLNRILPDLDSSPTYAPAPAGALRYRHAVDALDRVTEIRHPNGTRTVKQYRGLAVEESDREDTAAGSPHYGTPTTMVYDTRGSLVQVHQRLTDATIVAAYTYDVLDNLVAVRLTGGPNGPEAMSYAYDLSERRIRIQHVDAGVTRQVYTARGMLAYTADPLGRVTEYQYDQAGRLAAKLFPTTGESAVTYRYTDTGTAIPAGRNTVGRLESVDDAGGTVRFSYDARGRLAKHERTWPEFGASRTYAVDLAYDAADRLHTLTYPDVGSGSPRVALLHSYGEGNLLNAIEQVAAAANRPLISNIDYDARGQRRRVAFGNGVVSEFAYHPTDLNLASIRSYVPGGAVLQDLAYTHDREGNLLSALDNVANEGRFYRYDALYRLREAKAVDLSTVPFGADPAAAPGNVEGYSYSPDGDLEQGETGMLVYSSAAGRPHGRIETGNVTYPFDTAGRLERVEQIGPTSSQTIMACQYDSQGRLIRVERPADDTAVEITYDYEGERLRKAVFQLSTGTQLSETRYIGRWVSLHRSGAATGWEAVRLYVFDESRRLAVLNADGTPAEYIHPDHLGSAAAVSDQEGQLIGALQYKPFGAELSPRVHTNLRHRFNGKETDAETGLVNFGARCYLPELGRWIAPDPLLWSAPEKLLKNPQALNGYAYALNNPVTLIDPVGKSPGKYAGEYVDTRRYVTRAEKREDGTVVVVWYRVVEAKPGTWLSKVTYDFGWDKYYSKQEGYGAYDRRIVFPVTPDLQERTGPYDPDKVRPGELFAVREVTPPKVRMEPQGVQGSVPKTHSKEWSMRTIVGGGVTAGFGAEGILVEIKNRRTGETALFPYAGVGTGVSIDMPVGLSDWTDFTSDTYLSIDDFQGTTWHWNGGLGVNYDEWNFFGPKEQGKAPGPVTVSGTGPGGTIGVSVTRGELNR